MHEHPRQSFAEEALQKVGKNVLNLQKLEGMLKTLVTLSSVDGSSDDLLERHETRRDSISGNTLGTVVGEYIDTVYLGSPDKETGNPDEVYMSSTFRMEADAQTVEEVKESFSQLVAERNQLIHHRLVNFDIRSEESCQQLIAELDEQHKKIVPLYTQVQVQLKTLIEMNKISTTVLSRAISKEFDNDA